MRFIMINLFLVCLLLFGIGYLAFGDAVCLTDPNLHVHHVDTIPCGASFETF